MGIAFTIISALSVLVCFVNPVWGTCAYVAINIYRPNEHFEGVKFPAIPLMIVSMAVAYFVNYGKRLPRPPGPPQRSHVLMIIMMFLLLLHLLVWRPDDLLQWVLSEMAPVVLLTIYATQHMGTVGRVEAFGTAMLLGASVVTGQATFVHFLRREEPHVAYNRFGDEYISHGKLWDQFHLVNSGRLQGRQGGTWGNCNDLGMVANWAIPYGIYFFRRQGSKLLKILGAALVALNGVTLFLTGSRGGQLQLGVTLWSVLLGGKRKALGIILLLVALVGVVVVLPRLAPQREDTGESSSERLMLAKDGIKLFTWRPLTGVGFMSFPDFAFKTAVPHNVYIQCLAETGIIGAVIFFPMIFLMRRDGTRAKKWFDRREPNHALLAASATGLQLSYLIFLLFSNQFMRFTFAMVMMPAMMLYQASLRDRALQGEVDEEGEGEGEGAAEPTPGQKEQARIERLRANLRYPPRRSDGAAAEPEPAPPPSTERRRTITSRRYVFDPEQPRTGVTVEEEDEE